MHSYEDRIRAVELYIKLGKRDGRPPHLREKDGVFSSAPPEDGNQQVLSGWEY